MPQQLLFESDDVRITSVVAHFGLTSYQIANIGSVRIALLKKRNPFAITAFIVGFVLIVSAAVYHEELHDTGFSVAATGVGIMVAAIILQLVWPWWAFVLILNMSGGDVKALTSRNRKLVFDVKQAMEEAFIARAHDRT
jgi:hypothetical protein